MRLIVGFRFYTLFFVAAWLLSLPLLAQVSEVPQVPSTIQFANMTLHLTEQAQRDIQADVDALYRSPKYFQMKLERVDMYMPIIEPIFAEMGIPDDIKYLVIQESALISDAVSSSKAVGFWQFKETSATELDMRVDRLVDDRMNIAASTTGAAKYLLRSNATFDNWLYSLQSYQMGLGGASRSLNDRHYGAREMQIDGDTYWYVKKFLSHLVAFRDAIGHQPRNLMLYQYKNCANKTLEEISLEFNSDLAQLTEYNKWLKTDRVPDDREYVVIIPVQLDEAPNLLAEINAGNQQKNQKRKALEDSQFGERQKDPEVPGAVRDKLVIAEVNGIRAVVARPGDNARDLAKVGEISVANFLKFNDIRTGDLLKPGQVYYFKKKKKKASVYRHVLAQGETLWDVSQKYGVRMDKLLQKNRIKSAEAVKPGQVLWLRYIRPANEPVAYEAVPKQKEVANTNRSVGKAAVAQATPFKQPVKEQRNPKTYTASKESAPVAESTPQKEEKTLATQPRRAAEPPARQQAAVPAPQTGDAQRKQVSSREDQVLQGSQEIKAGADTAPIEYSEAVASQQAVVQVDTPRTKPVPSKEKELNAVNEPLKKNDTVSEADNHLYPEVSNAKGNVYPEKQEKRAEPAMQLIERKQHNPDSFGVNGPVKFIGEGGQLEQEPPLRTAPTQSLPTAPESDTAASAPLQPAAASQNRAVEQDSLHIVQAGETLYSISRKWGISVQDIRERNKMAPNTPLSIGQQLTLRAATKAQTQPTSTTSTLAQGQAAEAVNSTSPMEDNSNVYHTVAEGETMYRVARKYNVTIKDIMEWNKKSDFSIRPGEVLIVSRK